MDSFKFRYSENDMDYDRELAVREFGSNKFQAKLYIAIAISAFFAGVAIDSYIAFSIAIILAIFAVKCWIKMLHIKSVFRI